MMVSAWHLEPYSRAFLDDVLTDLARHRTAGIVYGTLGATTALLSEKRVGIGTGTVRVAFAARGDSLPFASVVLSHNGEIPSTDQLDGACRLASGERVEGWAWSRQEPGRMVALDIHIDGHFWQQALANIVVQELRKQSIGSGAHGFCFGLPDWLDPHCGHEIRLVIHGTNFRLPGSPITVLPAVHAEPDKFPAGGPRRSLKGRSLPS